MSKIKKQNNTAPKKAQEPIGSRIAKAVFEEKKISERIFGYISYEIYLCQLIAMDALQLFIPSMPPFVYILSSLALTMILAEIVYFASLQMLPGKGCSS